ncbi:hypothetical protein H8356DRAFT_1332030 [Neocallimastix lanati (nom. inval.)]|nr:hypothetical protein H8356DRAFT_1332030 [Neocallimastix sp. JGI-2020a]
MKREDNRASSLSLKCIRLTTDSFQYHFDVDADLNIYTDPLTEQVKKTPWEDENCTILVQEVVAGDLVKHYKMKNDNILWGLDDN